MIAHHGIGITGRHPLFPSFSRIPRFSLVCATFLLVPNRESAVSFPSIRVGQRDKTLKIVLLELFVVLTREIMGCASKMIFILSG